jgi:nucleolar complex protein 2
MAKKGTKATRKFAASGQLTKQIQARRKHQQIQRKLNKNKNTSSKGRERPHVDADEDEEENAKEIKSSKKRYVIPYHSVDDILRLHITPVLGCSLKGMSVDDFLGAGFMEEEDQDVSLDWYHCETPNILYDLGRRTR